MKKYGLVLAGGGAKGGYEIGVWKALKELNIPVSAVVGTSVGALNGAIMVQGDYNIAYNLWTNIEMKKVIDLEKVLPNYKKDLDIKDIILGIKNIILEGGLDVTPLKNILKKYIDEDNIRNSPIDFGLVTFSISNFQPIMLYKEDIPKGKLIEYLLASSCFPAFKPHKIEDEVFIDGGIYDNIPISLLINKNIKDIIVVDVSGIGRVKKVDEKDLNIIYIKNSQYLGPTLNFNGEISKTNIKIGYFDTLKIFKKLKGKRYYINSESNSSLLYDLKDSEVRNIINFLGFNEVKLPSNNKVTSILIKNLNRYSSKKITNRMSILAALEITAEALEVNRLNIYTEKELLDIVLSKYKELKDSNTSEFNIDSTVMNFNNISFNEFSKKYFLNNKYMICYNNFFGKVDVSIKKVRKLMAITFPKICISNIFITVVLHRINTLSKIK
ncbi:hypothetical protein CLOACE_06030 [Clostridium acetireducens DSM 10703]|uniref:PNPLA domain-containing protein n=1 Tax=Clostridium acetireducens DSM 10703 TaxID=1121290 RepID=A0A1E8F0Q7_9CLOT|nr:patatin-like phospholipase family protein [Clostridium acetireducens]OFI07017.1 hypothetical protein CLOACE_06030 [Clostridium acetireducens DSM 10703]